MGSVSQISEAGIRVTIRCNVDEDNWESIPQFLDDLQSGIAHKENVSVYFVPLNNVRMGENDVVMWRRIRDTKHLIAEAGFKSSAFMGLGLGFRTNRCMADGSSVLITPDGSLYLCEHCPKESRIGDVLSGVTDEAAKKEFSRVDRTLEKCRKCPYLPDCTSFANCPVQDTHCRDVHELMAADILRRVVETTENENTDGEDPIC